MHIFLVFCLITCLELKVIILRDPSNLLQACMHALPMVAFARFKLAETALQKAQAYDGDLILTTA